MCILHVYSYNTCDCLLYHLQSNEVSSSKHMEKEGLQQVLEFMKEKDLKAGVLVMDMHQQITKWMSEQHPNVKHYFDVWHIAKDECMCPYAYFTRLHLLVDVDQVTILHGFLVSVESEDFG